MNLKIFYHDSPIEKYLNILIQKKVTTYNEKINENNYKIKQPMTKEKKYLLNILL